MNRLVLKNASWIIGCKIAQSTLSFIIGLFTARYLGPSNFGIITYAASIVAFFIPIMQLGFNSTLVQEFLEKPEDEGGILGTALVLNLISAIISIIGVSAFVFIADKNEPETICVCLLYSLTLIFQASEMIQYWFQSKLLSKYPSIAALIAYILVSSYKIYILVSGKEIEWFAVTHVFETAIISFLLFVIYKRLGNKKISFSVSLGKEMFSRSRFYISASLIVVVFQQTDRIMLKEMLGSAETGYYSAAFTCVGVTGFVFMAIIDSMRPYILEGKKISREVLESRLTMLFAVITVISVIQGIVMTLLAKYIVFVLFGKAYAPAVRVLQVLVWQVVFGYYGTVRNIWILAEEKQKYLWKINFAGAVINVIGNACLIPVLGASGAALASVLTQVFTNFILCFVVKPMKPVGKIIIEAWNPKLILNSIKIIRRKKL